MFGPSFKVDESTTAAGRGKPLIPRVSQVLQLHCPRQVNFFVAPTLLRSSQYCWHRPRWSRANRAGAITEQRCAGMPMLMVHPAPLLVLPMAARAVAPLMPSPATSCFYSGRGLESTPTRSSAA